MREEIPKPLGTRGGAVERDKVRKCVNKDITAMEERENYTSLQELTDQSTTEGNRPILERSNGILSVNVTKILRDFMW